MNEDLVAGLVYTGDYHDVTLTMNMPGRLHGSRCASTSQGTGVMASGDCRHCLRQQVWTVAQCPAEMVAPRCGRPSRTISGKLASTRIPVSQKLSLKAMTAAC